jgi:hypothetical protein
MVAATAVWEVMEATMMAMVWALAMVAMVNTTPVILLITPLWALVDSIYMDKSEASFWALALISDAAPSFLIIIQMVDWA